jgi:DHA3 family macrolide efflux protein-like MFS transporter
MNATTHSSRSWKLPFFIIWGGEAISLIGSNLAQFALVWWLTESTGSATVLATATLVAMLPGIFLGPFAGAFVDRSSRRTIMIVSDAVAALAAACLAYLFWTGAIQVWQVYLVMFVRSVAGSFQWPAMQASTSLMVPGDQLARVAGLNQTMQGSLNIISPPLGALLLSVFPLQGIMGIDVVTAALAIIPLCFVAIPRPPRTTSAVTGENGRASLLADVRAGLRYVVRWPGLLAVMGMATVINFLLNPAFSLLPLLVTRHFGGGALQLGWMNSVQGAGIVLGGLILGLWGGFRRRIATSLTGLAGMGIGLVALGLAPGDSFWLALSAIGMVGLMIPIANGPIFAMLQAIVAPDMQGRVFTLIGSLTGAMSPLGLVVAGPLADRLGIQTWFLAGGVACLLMGIGAFMIPAIVHLEDDQEPATNDPAVAPLPINPPAGAVE